MTTHSTPQLEAEREAPTVGEVMHPGIVSCSQTATAGEIARIMATCRVHCVAVMDLSSDGKDPVVWGIVSDIDLLQAATGHGAETSAAGLAHQPVVSIRSTKPVTEAAEAMVTYGTSHLVVVDPERLVPLGIVSSIDIAQLLARDT